MIRRGDVLDGIEKFGTVNAGESEETVSPLEVSMDDCTDGSGRLHGGSQTTYGLYFALK